MGTLPNGRVQQIEFCESHWPVWIAAPATIGLTAAQVTAFKALTETARAKYQGAISAREASKSATDSYHQTEDDMAAAAGALINTIRAFAEQTANPGVYASAQIPPPAKPAPQSPPSTPTDVRITLEPGGAVTLKWKSRNASGAYFSIARRIGNASASNPFTVIGNSQRKTFTDNTLPLGSTNATYNIQGIRGERAGDASEPVLVQFGTSGAGGSLTIAGVTGGKLSMAA